MNGGAVEEHSNLGRTAGIPIRLSGTPADPVQPAPEFGRHTEEVLLALGYTWEQIERLNEDGVI